MAEQTKQMTEVFAIPRRRGSNLAGIWRVWRRKPLGLVSALIIGLVIVTGLIPNVISSHDPVDSVGKKLVSPRSGLWFGTDQLGRDVFSRVVHGARTALLVGLVAVATGTTLGALVGVLSGYFGGKFDMIMQRIMDGMLAIPALVLAMVIVLVLGPSTVNAIFAIGIVITPSQNRVIRSAVLSVRQNDYISASIALGATHARIMFRHVLPNVVPIILVLASALLGGAILTEASLSFLGMGTQPPHPSWGGMLSTEGRIYMQIAPWMAVFPGLAISITVLAFNLLGDAVRDIIDPRLKGSR